MNIEPPQSIEDQWVGFAMDPSPSLETALHLIDHLNEQFANESLVLSVLIQHKHAQGVSRLFAHMVQGPDIEEPFASRVLNSRLAQIARIASHYDIPRSFCQELADLLKNVFVSQPAYLHALPASLLGSGLVGNYPYMSDIGLEMIEKCAKTEASPDQQVVIEISEDILERYPSALNNWAMINPSVLDIIDHSAKKYEADISFIPLLVAKRLKEELLKASTIKPQKTTPKAM